MPELIISITTLLVQTLKHYSTLVKDCGVGDTDATDDELSALRFKLKELRRIRQELEELI